MKSLLLSFALITAFSSTTFAQIFPPELNWELGLNGGYGIATRPEGPPAGYCGTSTNINTDYSLRASYFFNPNWQITFDVGNRTWQSTGTWALIGKFGKPLQSQNITFLIADQAVSESIQMNFVIPFYTHFQVFNRANLYFGATFGMVTTINDGGPTYSTYKSGVDSGYAYVSKFDYNNGIGISLGIQTGFSYYIVPKLGFNIELGARYVNVNTTSDVNKHEVSNFYLVYFPATFGIRYKF